jgi:F-type H+-transporting ATPase subunit b
MTHELLAFAGEGGLLANLGINLKVLAVQVAIFVVTFAVLSRVLFGRTVDFLRQREEEVRKSREAVERDRAEVERLRKDYEARLAKSDKETYEKAQSVLREAMATAASLTARAQADAKAEVERAQAEIAAEKRQALAQLRSEVGRLSLEVAEKVLETKLDASHGESARKFIEGRI